MRRTTPEGKESTAGLVPRVLFKPEIASSQTRASQRAVNSRYSEATGDDNSRMYMVLASAIIRRPVSEECNHPKCTRPKEVSRGNKECSDRGSVYPLLVVLR